MTMRQLLQRERVNERQKRVFNNIIIQIFFITPDRPLTTYAPVCAILIQNLGNDASADGSPAFS